MFQELITILLKPDTSLDVQVSIIEKLNQHMFDAEVLLQLVQILKQKMVAVPGHKEAVDIVGTGGDGFDTINFSTLGAIVAAGAGVKVAKHGNKGSTSKCGSFDLLSHLGVKLCDSPEGVSSQLEKYGLSFLFAPYFHPVLANVKEARKVFAAKGQKTIFNCLGPLLNPASVETISTGVFTPELIKPYAQVLKSLGVKNAFVAHGSGMDEFTLTGPTEYARLKDGDIKFGSFEPAGFGFKVCDQSELTGGDIDQNVSEALSILSNKIHGPKRDMVLVQAASVIALKRGCVMSEALKLADESLTSGQALQKLKELSNEA